MASVPELQDVAVLVVDDNDDNLDLLEDYLEDEVWSVLRAQSGVEAVRLAAAHHPDAVVLDLMMPGMNGLAVIRALRAMEQTQQTPFILQTAYADRENVLTARRLGCQHVLGKPLEKERLLAELRSCLAERPEPQPGARLRASAAAEQPPAPSVVVQLDDALERVDASRVSAAMNDTDTIDTLHELVDDDSPLGQRLVAVANSAAYGGTQRVTSVAQALVRLGTRKTSELIQKASAAGRGRVNPARIESVMRLLQTITTVFPERTQDTASTRALLMELSQAAQQADGRPSGSAAGPAAARANEARP